MKTKRKKKQNDRILVYEIKLILKFKIVGIVSLYKLFKCDSFFLSIIIIIDDRVIFKNFQENKNIIYFCFACATLPVMDNFSFLNLFLVLCKIFSFSYKGIMYFLNDHIIGRRKFLPRKKRKIFKPIIRF